MLLSYTGRSKPLIHLLILFHHFSVLLLENAKSVCTIYLKKGIMISAVSFFWFHFFLNNPYCGNCFDAYRGTGTVFIKLFIPVLFVPCLYYTYCIYMAVSSKYKYQVLGVRVLGNIYNILTRHITSAH